jgi:hypothetical protein
VSLFHCSKNGKIIHEKETDYRCHSVTLSSTHTITFSIPKSLSEYPENCPRTVSLYLTKLTILVDELLYAADFRQCMHRIAEH